MLRSLLLRIPVLLAGLLLAGSLHAQTFNVPAVGTDETFNVATWNVEHFGIIGEGPTNVQLQFNNVLRVMEQANVHLWALQEMNNPNTFNQLVEALGDGWAGFWQADQTSFDIGYGYIYRTDVVQPLQVTTILTSFAYEFASRPPLLMRANVTLPGGTVQNLRIINIHAKCCSDVQSHTRRRDGAIALKNYTDNFLAINAPLMVLGDFNDRINASITVNRPSPYANFRDDANYFFATLAPVENAGKNTYCGNASCSSGSPIDHILVNAPLRPFLAEGSTHRYDALLTNIPSYVSTTSDHVAVYTRFDFFGTTSTAETTRPDRFALEAPFPNPFQGEATLAFTLPEAATVRLEAFDALGRRVATVADGPYGAGAHSAVLNGAALTPGLYLVRLTAESASGRHSATRRVVRVP